MGGLVDIGFVRLDKDDATMRGSDPSNVSVDTGTAYVRDRIERELNRRGLISDHKIYVVFYEGGSYWACGGGAYPPLLQGRVGAIYLRGQPAGQAQICADSQPWGKPDLAPNYIDYAWLHETVHTIGFVPPSTIHQHSQGHVFDLGATAPERDLMYAPRPQMPDPYWATGDPAGLVLDVGRDDYFRPPSGLDLDTSSLLAPLVPGAYRPIGW